MTKRPPGVNIALRRSRLSEQGNDALKYIKASQGEELEQEWGQKGRHWETGLEGRRTWAAPRLLRWYRFYYLKSNGTPLKDLHFFRIAIWLGVENKLKGQEYASEDQLDEK